MENESKRKGERRGKRRVKKIAMIVAASLTGISTAAVASTLVVYDSMFDRFERPEYSLYPGMYCYERFGGTLVREELSLPSGEISLAAYYYPIENAKGLCVLAHGFHAGADDYLPLIEALMLGGYAVFTYDVTGNYSSGGESGIGMCQQLVDLDRVLTYLAASERFAAMPKVLLGHSWGGYAAGSALKLHPEVKACALIAPMYNGSTIMVEKGEQYTGKLAYTAKPIFDVYQKYLFGDYTKLNAVIGINAVDIPILVAQGLDDGVIAHDKHSVTAHLDEIENPNVTVYYGTGSQGTHTGIWHSREAEEYVRTVASELALLAFEKGEALTDAERAAFYETIDHRLYSEVNAELVTMILDTFNAGVAR